MNYKIQLIALILSTVNVNLNWQSYVQTLKPKSRLHFLDAILEPIELSVFSLMGAQRSVSYSPVGSQVLLRKCLSLQHAIIFNQK